MVLQARLTVTGRVQGVGFRFTCKQLARGYEIVGWVRDHVATSTTS